jgi:hypothetical protein
MGTGKQTDRDRETDKPGQGQVHRKKERGTETQMDRDSGTQTDRDKDIDEQGQGHR